MNHTERMSALESVPKPASMPVAAPGAYNGTHAPKHPPKSPAPAKSPAPPRAAPSMGRAAFHGPVGRYVDAILEETEADPNAVLVQALALVGNCFGPHKQLQVGRVTHRANLFVIVVGATSRGRKGTALSEARSLVARVDPDWYGGRVKSGLTSGEGLIYNVRDPVPGKVRNNKKGDDDPGEPDKRLMCIETEFATVLACAGRDGSTLGPVLRQAFDGQVLSTLVKNDPTRATGSHVSVVGHITPAELRKKLTAVDAESGSANRFLMIHSVQSRQLPFGGEPDGAAVVALRGELHAAWRRAQKPGVLTLSQSARPHWEVAYRGTLARERPGLLGKLTARSPAHVLRLALVYALADGAGEVLPEHLAAALAVHECDVQTKAFVFGDETGNPTADAVRDMLRAAGPAGLKRSAINDKLNGHKSKDEIDAALGVLELAGFAFRRKVATAGRSAELWAEAEEEGEAEQAPQPATKPHESPEIVRPLPAATDAAVEAGEAEQAPPESVLSPEPFPASPASPAVDEREDTTATASVENPGIHGVSDAPSTEPEAGEGASPASPSSPAALEAAKPKTRTRRRADDKGGSL